MIARACSVSGSTYAVRACSQLGSFIRACVQAAVQCFMGSTLPCHDATATASATPFSPSTRASFRLLSFVPDRFRALRRTSKACLLSRPTAGVLRMSGGADEPKPIIGFLGMGIMVGPLDTCPPTHVSLPFTLFSCPSRCENRVGRGWLALPCTTRRRTSHGCLHTNNTLCHRTNRACR
jgi:hypothetical protein